MKKQAERAPRADDPAAEWQGMPEFVHRDLRSVQAVKVHFATREDAQAFARLVGQTITDRTKSMWYPRAETIGNGVAE